MPWQRWVSGAREGLRQAYLGQHVPPTDDEECADVRSRLPAFVRGRPGSRSRQIVRQHLDTCLECAAVAAEMDEMSSRLGALMAPAVAGIVAGAATGPGLVAGYAAKVAVAGKATAAWVAGTTAVVAIGTVAVGQWGPGPLAEPPSDTVRTVVAAPPTTPATPEPTPGPVLPSTPTVVQEVVSTGTTPAPVDPPAAAPESTPPPAPVDPPTSEPSTTHDVRVAPAMVWRLPATDGWYLIKVPVHSAGDSTTMDLEFTNLLEHAPYTLPWSGRVTCDPTVVDDRTSLTCLLSALPLRFGFVPLLVRTDGPPRFRIEASAPDNADPSPSNNTWATRGFV
ncbi:zf-HC2 domain-containing protein [Aeromicrobium marinum]|uniref:zf-HC2 domain-containing protein n=1 Tax=Aeromicrobium marinum TaxID=219314 RepID=UPI00067FFECA|nr:zf-HC2 domain-containing protein [Aeromicrobium marinum]